MNILIVDDSATIRLAMRMLLKKEYSDALIVEAVDGKNALHALTENVFDLIITDLEMGEHDGDKFIEKLLNNKILKKKKIIIYSSSEDYLIRFKLKVPKNVRFINKTEKSTEIMNKIRQFIDEQIL